MSAAHPAPLDERVLIVMPVARDAERTAQLLAAESIPCCVCADVPSLCREIERGAAAALLTDQVLRRDEAGELPRVLRSQPSWSAFPLVVLTQEISGGPPPTLAQLPNATLVERPLRMRTLLSVVQAALRDRRHQYEARAAVAALERQSATFDAVLAALQEFVYVLDLEGRFTFANKTLLDLWQRTPAEALGRTFAELDYPPELAARLAAQLADVVRTRSPIQGETVYTSPAGQPGYYEYTFVPLFGPDGSVVAIGGATRDVTERHQAEEAAREADRRKDEFLAMLAHELRNPLSPIATAAQILRRQGGGQEVFERHCAVITRQVGNMGRLLDDLLDLSRVTHGTVQLQKQPLELSSLSEQALEVVRPLLAAKGHTIEVDLAADPLPILADRLRIEQVIVNLLNNAAKYTDPGGRLSLRTFREGGVAGVEVADSGIGISGDLLPRVFDLFTQGERGLDRSQGGLGIGLTLVRSLVELHGGTVQAESSGPGQGSRFTVRLPLNPRRWAGAPAANQPPAPNPTSRARVLVVDDNHDAADGLAELIEAWGYDTRVAYDGLSALAAAADYLPQVVILDIGMPRMDGYEAARQLRQNPALQGARLIALTGYGQAGDRRAAWSAGFNVHFTKPVNPEALRELLAETG